jgi:hypothetical protein
MASRKVLVKTYPGVGGPEKKKMASDGFGAGPTDAGEYAVAYCAPHSSYRYPDWSKITWGTKLKEAKRGEILAFQKGRWVPLRTITPVSRDEILDYHEELYGTRVVPKTWVFNDFGHITCYYFKDLNKNRRRDKEEGIHPEFFHTTPIDEANTAIGQSVILTESHGCIHVKPQDIDEMVDKGYLAKGNLVFIHKYAKKSPLLIQEPGSVPYEVHFYPAAEMILIMGIKH